MERVISEQGISIGTGLAIEGLSNVPLHNYQTLMFNMRTLFRNALGAYERRNGERLPNVDIMVRAIEEDLIGIARALESLNVAGGLNLIFYQPTYKGMTTTFPLAKLKIINSRDNTPYQVKVENFRQKVTEALIDKFDKLINVVDVRIPNFEGRTLLLSHHTVDLVTVPYTTRLYLLESHTGAVKHHSDFYTKLTNGKELSNIPLNKLTIQVFGDKAVNFYSMNHGIKEAIKELAQTFNWSTVSTPSFCHRTISGLHHDNPDREVLLKLIS